METKWPGYEVESSSDFSLVTINQKSKNKMSVDSFEVYVLAHVASRISSSPSIRHPGKFSRQFLLRAFFVYKYKMSAKRHPS